MMSLLGALFLLVGFVLILKQLKLVEKSGEVLVLSRLAYGDIKNPAMSDEDKEVALQGHAKRLFVLFFILTVGLAAALLVPFAVLWLGELAGLIALDSVISMALSWQFILGSTVVLVLAFRVMSARAT